MGPIQHATHVYATRGTQACRRACIFACPTAREGPAIATEQEAASTHEHVSAQRWLMRGTRGGKRGTPRRRLSAKRHEEGSLALQGVGVPATAPILTQPRLSVPEEGVGIRSGSSRGGEGRGRTTRGRRGTWRSAVAEPTCRKHHKNKVRLSGSLPTDVMPTSGGNASIESSCGMPRLQLIVRTTKALKPGTLEFQARGRSGNAAAVQPAWPDGLRASTAGNGRSRESLLLHVPSLQCLVWHQVNSASNTETTRAKICTRKTLAECAVDRVRCRNRSCEHCHKSDGLLPGSRDPVWRCSAGALRWGQRGGAANRATTQGPGLGAAGPGARGFAHRLNSEKPREHR